MPMHYRSFLTRLTGLAIAGLLVSATLASAGPIDVTYDLTSGTLGRILPGDEEHEIVHPLTVKGVTLTITAFDFESVGGSITARNDALITANALGMGVFSDEDSSGVEGRTEGLDLDELLSFAFTVGGNPVDVQLLSAVFQTFDSPGRVRLFIGGDNIPIATLFGSPNNIVQQIGTGSNPFTLDFEPFSLSGSLLEFGTKAEASQWRLVSLTVRIAEPGTLAILGFGLAGLGLMRRRRAF